MICVKTNVTDPISMLESHVYRVDLQTAYFFFREPGIIKPEIDKQTAISGGEKSCSVLCKV
jgi:hypothetical protein